uniref:Uncharacterized protein n=2 Tax=Nicotiana TaxID=4085 RepID=A0A1S4AQL0_TOBAC|nr:PREDICTED: uncharacterized protein LOC104219016 [Nicotiana sylvestris]XP_009767951.1 PREDICTED: uncharacterized protein LOC104219016 [Nicotiana sylvestris]XP_016479036.1 PREDICTED: uncharacterized protein LOC107800385 [Nicotiana tabacum]XP_016479037.1 PREDICTED: uncharacterized protein LOC107800385 [Nicotiana tabacum]
MLKTWQALTRILTEAKVVEQHFAFISTENLYLGFLQLPLLPSNMTDHQNPKPTGNLPQTPSTNPPKISGGSSNGGFSGGHNYPNPPDRSNPDPATLREQWRFAIRQYSKWYSHAWGTAILAGLSFYALGWIIKGSNPLPSFKREDLDTKNASSSDVVADVAEVKRS